MTVTNKFIGDAWDFAEYLDVEKPEEFRQSVAAKESDSEYDEIVDLTDTSIPWEEYLSKAESVGFSASDAFYMYTPDDEIERMHNAGWIV